MSPSRTLLAPSVLCSLAVLSVAVIGCGGGRAASGPGQGRLVVQFEWPKPGRLIPIASKSIRLQLVAGDLVLKNKVLVPPAPPGTTTRVEFDDLPAGDLQVTATAYPTVDASPTDVAQATRSATLHVTPNGTTEASLVMDSTIDHLVLAPTGVALVAGDSTSITATAVDTKGRTVLTAESTWTWESSDTAKITVSGVGPSVTLTARAAGTAQVTVKETESKTSAIVPATITAAETSIGLASGPWPKYHGDALNSGASDASGATGQIRWALQIMAGSLDAPPIVGADGTVYVTARNRLVAINGSTGAKRWEYAPDGVYGMQAAPTLGSNGLVYVTAVLALPSQDGIVVAVHSDTGREAWRSGRIGGGNTGFSSPTIESGRVFVYSGGQLSAVDAKTGLLRWKVDRQGNVPSSPAVRNGLVVIDNGMSLMAYKADDGTLAWSMDHGSSSFPKDGPEPLGQASSPCIASDGTVYTVGASNLGRYGDCVFAVELSTGQLKWVGYLDDQDGTSISAGGAPAIGRNGNVYVVGNGGFGSRLIEFEPATHLWTGRTWMTGLTACSPGIDGSGTIFAGAGKTLYAIGPGFKGEKWEVSVGPDGGGYFASSPAIGQDGTIFVGGTDGKLYAIR